MGFLFLLASTIRDAFLAGAIFDSVVAFEGRLAILDATFNNSQVVTNEERDIWIALSARLRKLYKKRHEVAHFTVMDPDLMSATAINPFLTFNQVVRETTRELTIHQIVERTAKFSEAEDAVVWFTQRIRPRVRPEESPPQQGEEPPLIARIRELAAQKNVVPLHPREPSQGE